MYRGFRVYRRDALYDLVWAKPMRDAAKDFSVSDTALKKTCRKLGVPTPPQGYWNQVTAGKPVFKIPLPELRVGQTNEIYLRSWINDSPRASEEALAIADRERQTGTPIVVASKLKDPHPLVLQTRDVLRDKSPFDGRVSARNSALDVCVSPKSIDRALTIMDALVKAVEDRSFAVVVKPPRQETEWGRPIQIAGETCIQVGEESVAIELNEAIDVVRPAAPKSQERYPRLPTGRFVLSMYAGGRSRRWHDRKRRKIESYLNEFVAHLYIAADWAKQKRLADEEEERRREEEQRLREEEEERQRVREERIEGLDSMLERWRRVRDIREFASQIRGLVHASAMKITEGGPLHEEIAWMLSYADELDPLRALRAKLEGRDDKLELQGPSSEPEDED
jgi:hypothetical protein